jgi:hypothetical protein
VVVEGLQAAFFHLPGVVEHGTYGEVVFNIQGGSHARD